MNDLKNLLLNIYRQTSFGTGLEHQSKEDTAYLYKSQYGKFHLTEAIRPGRNLEVIPTQGFRHEPQNRANCRGINTLTASVSKELLFDTFLNLLEPLGNVVDVVLESSHNMPELEGFSGEMYRECIDTPVLLSILYHYEDLLINDGCTGIAVLNPRRQSEVQFDEHKLLVVYAPKLTPYESILIDSYVDCNEKMKVITQSEHVHCSSNRYAEQFSQLRYELGID